MSMSIEENDAAIAKFKEAQREGWAHFIPFEHFTTPPAAMLAQFSHLESGMKVLDIACGTGVVAITLAHKRMKVSALDLSPVLLERARHNAKIAEVEVDFKEGDVEALPYGDATFDAVVSQFGHMFAPRPEVAVSEMLRVLKPGGRLAFSTWPPQLFTGSMFALVGRYLPTPPRGVSPPPEWGNSQIVRDRLGGRVTDLEFEEEVAYFPTLSPKNYRHFFENSAAAVMKVVETLKNQPEQLKKFRNEFEALIAQYFKNNRVEQRFLMTRAIKQR